MPQVGIAPVRVDSSSDTAAYLELTPSLVYVGSQVTVGHAMVLR